MTHFARTFAVLLGVFGAQAALASATFSFSGAGVAKDSAGASSSCAAVPGTSAATSTCWGNTRGYSATESVTGTSIGVVAKAYSNTGAASSAGTNANAPLQTAYLGSYSGGGLGVTNRDYASSTDGAASSETIDGAEATTPEHALDNNQRYDMILLSFTQGVALSSVDIGYAPYDSDLSVWAYVGTGTPVLDGATYASLLSSASGLVSSGWVIVGKNGTAGYADAGTGAEAVNAGGLVASHWLVGAFQPTGTSTVACGTTGTAAATGSAGDLDCGDDYVKLLGVSIADQSTPTTEVPEPGTLLLTGLALAGLAVRRHCRK